MALPVWDPWQLFNLTTWATDSMRCVGTSMSEPPLQHRCIWDIEHENFIETCSIISKIRTKPPNEALPDLAKLATLCLCSTHQSQKSEVTDKWKALVKCVGEQYEKVENLKRNIHVLKTNLEEIKEEHTLNKEKYERSMEENAKLVKEVAQHKLTVSGLRQKFETLIVQLRNTKARFNRQFELARRIMSNSSAATAIDIGKLRSELEKERETTVRLTSWYPSIIRNDRTKQLAEDLQELEEALQTWGMYKWTSEAESERHSIVIRILRAELENERLDMEEYKTAAGEERECHLLQIQKIRSELDRQHRIEKKDRRAIDIERRGMLFVIRSIHAALERERQITIQHKKYHEELRGEMEQAMRIAGNRDASLLGEIFTLQIKLEKFEEMENDLILTKSNETALYEQVRNLNSQLICAHESKNKLDGEYAEIKAREATLSKGLEVTQLSLKESRSANEELKNIAAENELDFIVERSQLLTHINEVEKQLSTTFWSVLRGKVNGWTTFGVQWGLRSISRSWIFARKEKTKRDN